MDNQQNFYKDLLLLQSYRIVSLEDWNACSPTFGCFDRDYWAWKSKDMQDACMQNGVYILAMLWNSNFEGNIYYKNEKVFKHIIVGVERWFRIQHSNGSFDQIFPNEYSYGATALTLFYMLLTYDIIKDNVSDDFKEAFLKHCKKAANFITLSNETHDLISNHRAAAAAALYFCYKISNDENYLYKSKQIIKSFSNSNKEGWLPEYSGADPGYQTLSLYYLAKIYNESSDLEIFDIIEKSIDFLSYFITPEGYMGGHYASRNTDILYPAGFALVSNKSHMASKIFSVFKNSIHTRLNISLCSVDDSNIIPVFIGYLEAFLKNNTSDDNQANSSTHDVLLPIENKKTDKYFEQAGMYILGNERYYAILNVKKNGLLEVWDKHSNKILYKDYGYFAQDVKGNKLSSQFYNTEAEWMIRKNSVFVNGYLSKISMPTQTPFNIFLLRFLNLTLCRSKTIGSVIKRILVKILIKKKQKPLILYKREIVFSDDKIFVKDYFEKKNQLKITSFARGAKHSTIHMATSDYFRRGDLSNLESSFVEVETLNKKNKIEQEFVI